MILVQTSRRWAGALVLAWLGACSSSGDAWDGGPAGTDPIEHVLMISVDGLHGVDLQRYVTRSPASTLARLAAVGTRYSDVSAPFPSDSYPGVLAWATGGTPRSTGVYYDLSYDRTLSPPGTDCSTTGTIVDFTEAADKNPGAADGGGGLEPFALPRDPRAGCAPVLPHQYLRVNTLFEVVEQAGLRTAWADKHLSYEVLQGRSGAGVDDLYDPEVAAVDAGSFAAVEAYDDAKVDAILHEIDGEDHAGAPAAVPAVFGMDFQAVSVWQKASGYLDSAGTPSADVQHALDDVDASLGRIVDELSRRGLWSSTVVVITASHGQSPIDPARVRRLPTALVPGLVDAVAPDLVAAATEDAVALLWLRDPARTAEVAAQLMAHREEAGIDHVLSGAELVAMFGDPAADARVPDLIAVVDDGVIYTDSHKKLAEHGGASDDDRKVALLVVGGSAPGQVMADPVETRQLAPTILAALALDPARLDAVAAEQTAVLPGLSFAR